MKRRASFVCARRKRSIFTIRNLKRPKIQNRSNALQSIAGLCPSRDKSSDDGTADDTAYENYVVPLREECEENGTYFQPLNCSPTCPKVQDSKKRCGITIPVHLVRRWLIVNATILPRHGPVYAISFGGSKTNPVVARLKTIAPNVYTDVQPFGIHRSVLSVPYR
jgi:hypothetical protein